MPKDIYDQDSERPSRRETTVANRRSLYPLGLDSNTNSVNVDSSIMPKDIYDQDSEKPSRRESSIPSRMSFYPSSLVSNTNSVNVDSLIMPKDIYDQDSENPSRRESTVANRRSLYPIGLDSNTNSVNVDSLMMPKDINITPDQEISNDDKMSITSLKSTGRETAILSGTGRVTHIMDQNSFTAVNINTNSQEIRNVESFIKKYQTDSYPASVESLKNPDTYSGFYDDALGASGSYPSGFEMGKRNSSMILPPSGSIDPSPLDANLAARMRDSQLSVGTLPYFIIED
jgi:hypothetical protein